MSDIQVVRSKGIYHGLPVYEGTEIDNAGLTALVAGANGISGYHMVKVLSAAPAGRWKRIYCLSRRSPPEYFFEELGKEGPARVTHVAVDFLDEPGEIAEKMRREIQHVSVPVFLLSRLWGRFLTLF